MSSWDELIARHYGRKLLHLPPAWQIRPCSGPESALARTVLLDADDSVYFAIDRSYRSWPAFEAQTGIAGLQVQVVARDGRRARTASHRLLPLVISTVEMLRDARGTQQRLHVIYVDDTSKRYLPATCADPVLPVHINGGMTISDSLCAKVIVYRREDAEKVMIHELVHAFNIDLSLRAGVQADAQAVAAFGVRQHPPFSRSIGLGEAYTEALACFLFACTRMKGHAGSISVAADEIASRVLAHFGRSRMLHLKGAPMIVEGTHVAAYTLGRAALLRPKWLRHLVTSYPPDRPPADPNQFCSLLIAAAADWDKSRTTADPVARKISSRSLSFERQIRDG